MWFVVAELLQKALPDGQKNESLFTLVIQFLSYLDRVDILPEALETSLLAFELLFMQQIGLAIHHPVATVTYNHPEWFSQGHGGFHNTPALTDSVPVSEGAWQLFVRLQKWEFAKQSPDGTAAHRAELRIVIDKFVTYQLEREIKSKRFLAS